MFSKSKRFENKPVGCGADAAYNPKENIKPVGGVIPKVDRFGCLKTANSLASDNESVHSEKSSVFRTPKSINRIPTSSASKNSVKAKLNFEIKSFSKDIIDSKNVEIRNKDATISEYEAHIKELNNTINNLTDEISKLKNDVSKQAKCACKELEENLALVKSHHKLALDANESIRNEYKLETDNLKLKHDEEIQSMKINYKNEIDNMKKIHGDDLENVTKGFADKIKKIEDEFYSQVKHIEENAQEKIKICEIQNEEEIQNIQAYHKSIFKQECQIWETELKKCQDAGRKECDRLESKIHELKEQLEESSKNVLELSNSVSCLQKTINAKETQLCEFDLKLQSVETTWNDERSNYRNEIDKLKSDFMEVSNDKNKFSFTLNTARQTIEVLSSRLKNSDEDVERYKNDIDKITFIKDDYESELAKTKKEFDDFKNEYNTLLFSIISSKTALDNNHKMILEKNNILTESLHNKESEHIKEINCVKNHLISELNSFKEHALTQLEESEKQKKFLSNSYQKIKSQYEEAYQKINESKNLCLTAEYQLEVKDQEIQELETENHRLAGTLAAVEQEKNELRTLLDEFKSLMDVKNSKITDYQDKLLDSEGQINSLDERLKKVSEFLVANEFIINEKDNEILQLNNKLSIYVDINEKYNTIQSKLSEYKCKMMELENEKQSLLLRNEELKSNICKEDVMMLQDIIGDKDNFINLLESRLSNLEEKLSEADKHYEVCKEALLQSQCKKLEEDLEEITSKYTGLLSHQNVKQKIKHINELKEQKSTLREENERLNHKLQKQTALIEKLKKDIKESTFIKSPAPSNKLLNVSTPRGKENMGSPLGKSPKTLLDRTLTPLKDSNH